MTTGALIFAFNNEQTDYVRMAAWSADNIRRHLDIPVAVVTDEKHPKGNFDRVIYTAAESGGARYFGDYDTTVTWNNAGRVNAFELSPWDQTLVLDADYVVAGDQLKVLLDSQEDFMCHRFAYDITGLQTFDDLNWFGKNRMPMWWATVMMFRRSKKAQVIFEAMAMIREHWTHYRNLYGNPRDTYRNDHALSIALNIENGHTLKTCDIPWSLASIAPEHKLSKLDVDHYRVDFVTSDKKSRWVDIKQDFHAMGKKHLGEIVENTA